ncbi:MAG: RIP metalloprotease RseP [Eubacteriales bacterium]|nr:RIP metalloprotease RseP [Eubacteriales bacterium]
MTVVTIVLAILAFGFLITAHELGHFVAARVSGVRVNEFWIGMGPAIFHHPMGETEFKLCIFPFGGACVMEGEDEETSDPHCFTKASPWRRMLILVAGAAMNFVVGFLLVLLLSLPTKQAVIPVLASLEPGFASESAEGLLPGDRILSIDGYRVYQTSDVTLTLNLSTDDTYDVVVLRDGQKLQQENVRIPLQHFEADEEGVMRYGLNFTVKDLTIGERLQQAVYTSYNYARVVWVSLRELVTGHVGVKDLSGPVGVTDVLVQTARSSLVSFFMMVAFISINLGVMNLLPLPALDGGRLLFVLIELILRRPVSRKYEAYIHGAGMALLMVLMVYITWQDILRLVAG